jgi:hypothetical protein
MAIVFPPNPAGQTPSNTFSTTSTPLANTTNGYTYVWNGSAWTSTGSGGGGGGTVTSVNVSGGTTGLTYTGGPVTTSGTITMAGVLGIANGGTGTTTQAGALNALLPAQTGQGGKVLGTNGSTVSWVTSGVDLPAGTALPFYQAAAPTGWTQVTTAALNNSAIRVVTGAGGVTGGTQNFTTAFASYTPGGSVASTALGTALSTSQMPSHLHVMDAETGSFNVNSGAFVCTVNYLSYVPAATSPFPTCSTGSGATHTHTVNSAFTGTASTQFQVKYLDFIIATKN